MIDGMSHNGGHDVGATPSLLIHAPLRKVGGCTRRLLPIGETVVCLFLVSADSCDNVVLVCIMMLEIACVVQQICLHLT